MHLADPTFPPLLKGHDVPGSDDAFEIACARASSGELGAGDVVWGRSDTRTDIAIILEPEVSLETSVQMLPLAMVALGDCLGALTPPQVGQTFTWPGVIRLNGGLAGAMKAAAGGKRDAGSVPGWMVIGLWLRHLRGKDEPEPGDVPDQTWLSEEGCEDLTRTEILESYSRHFLTWLHTWNEDGFKSIHASWLYRAHEREGDISFELGGESFSGEMSGLDDNGNLLYRDGDVTKSALLMDAFEFPEA